MVFDVAQKLVGLAEGVEVRAGDVLFVVKFLQGKQRSPRPQPGFFSSVNSLQALDQELNISNATPVELDITGLHSSLGMEATSGPLVDSFPGLKCGFDGRKIHIAPINQR